ncbi:hypothetical protein K2173_010892 [Erythroxylum novogranatense]|uniref:Carboxypeptidase n=1 Tax=Erythroxylum novogranatense TaxID=1862640 RepID=A0AAV8T0W3_9ROSI|nr:hypothetical protein K2173_010892 [Erythroxylum novogranatense]
MKHQLRWITIAVIYASFVQILCRELTGSQSQEDNKITSLPGQPNVSFQQYGGYIAVDESQNRALFYYFVEAESDPDSKPLVFWLNGGPGCSSLGGGGFSENGPFRPTSAGTLLQNDYSWNKEANILYLESPAGVGFSYSKNSSFYDHVNDTITAQDNFIFLQNWLLKFPQYKNRDLYITGESYAGHYVPQFAQLIVQSGLQTNLKGIAIGNPLMEFDTDINSIGDYYRSHGLISDEAFQFLSVTCNISRLQKEQLHGHVSASCQQVELLLSEEIPQDINPYDITADNCLSDSKSPRTKPWNYVFRPTFRYSSSNPKSQKSINHPKVEVDPCLGGEVDDYLNRKDVQEALHAQLVDISNWTGCSVLVRYDLNNVFIPTINVVGSLVESGIRVLIYSGDQDSVIPFIGSRAVVKNLATNLGLNATGYYRAWFENQQIGGWTQTYGGGKLTFATIRGAGHLAPYTSPRRSLAFFKAFISGKPLPEAY